MLVDTLAHWFERYQIAESSMQHILDETFTTVIGLQFC